MSILRRELPERHNDLIQVVGTEEKKPIQAPDLQRWSQRMEIVSRVGGFLLSKLEKFDLEKFDNWVEKVGEECVLSSVEDDIPFYYFKRNDSEILFVIVLSTNDGPAFLRVFSNDGEIFEVGEFVTCDDEEITYLDSINVDREALLGGYLPATVYGAPDPGDSTTVMETVFNDDVYNQN